METIQSALVGNYQPEHILALAQALTMYDAHQAQLETCDQQIAKSLLQLSQQQPSETPRDIQRIFWCESHRFGGLGELLIVDCFGLCRRHVADGLSRRRWLNQSTHSSVASSTASRLCQDRRCSTSALYRPLMVSARALS